MPVEQASIHLLIFLAIISSIAAYNSSNKNISSRSSHNDGKIGKTFMRGSDHPTNGPLRIGNHANQKNSLHLDAYVETNGMSSIPLSPRASLLVPTSNISSNDNDFVKSAEKLEKMTNIEMIDRELLKYGMPWKDSIAGKRSGDYADNFLHYMSFFRWQLSYMKNHLTGLEMVPIPDEFSLQVGSSKKSNGRVFNICLKSKEYRKIRMTYYDVGNDCQVFNSLWYPDPTLGNLPLLGIDIMSFNARKRNLAIVDFQPIREDGSDESSLADLAAKINSTPISNAQKKLSHIKKKNKSLQGKMSKRFYDETQFFSKDILFAKYDFNGIFDVCKCLFPAYQDYVRAHVAMVHDCQRLDGNQSNIDSIDQNTCSENDLAEYVMRRQKAYDDYSVVRDPAVAMFNKMFGKEWSENFAHEFLFDLSSRPDQH